MTCGNIQGAYSGHEVNVGWYGYKVAKNCHLRYGPGDNFESVQQLKQGERVGVQSTRNPKSIDDPPKRPTVVDNAGRHWAWVYVKEGGKVGWVKVSCVCQIHSALPWARGPRGQDFHIGLEKATRGPRTSCHGGRRNKVRVINADHVRLRYHPKGTAYHWLQKGDTVRELFRRSLDDYAVVTVINSELTKEGTRGWVRVATFAEEKVTGIDVSAHQGSVDFKKVKASGERFVICKATEGEGFVDPRFFENVKEARAAFLEVGAYHFLRPRPGRSGTAEADDFLRALKRARLGKGDIRPTVDIEVTALGAQATQIYVGQFVGALRMAGFDAMLYTFPAFMEWTRTFSTDLWIAHFGARRPTIPDPWKSYAIWQWTSGGRVPGVSGNVDRNRCPDLSRIIQR